MYDANEINALFAVFLDNCSDELLRQTIRFNPEPNAVKAAEMVIAHRANNRSAIESLSNSPQWADSNESRYFDEIGDTFQLDKE